MKRSCTGKNFTSVLLGTEVQKTALPGMVRQHRNGTAEEDRILKTLESDSQNGNVVKTQTALINESGLYSLIQIQDSI